MTDSEVQNLIVQRFDSSWDETQIEYPNTRIDKDLLDEWVRLSIQINRSRQIGLGKTAKRGGTIHVQVFTRVGTAQGRCLELAEKAARIFDIWDQDSIVIHPYDISIQGEKATMVMTTTEVNWFQINCMVDYTYVS